MKRILLLCLSLLICGASGLFAQGGGITYQGRLEAEGLPANGTYDFEFTIYDDEKEGKVIGATIRLRGIQVTDGLFTVELNFRELILSGQACWLEIGVGAEGSVVTLSPRQKLTPTPYAMTAGRALSADMVASSGVSGYFPNAVSFMNPDNYFAGDGSSLSNLALTAVGPPGTFDHATTLEAVPTFQFSTSGNGPVTVAAGDLNGDGLADMAVANAGSGTVNILINGGNAEYNFGAAIVFGAGFGTVRLFDMNRDGRLDVFCSGGNSIGIAQNLGSGLFAVPSFRDAARTLSTFDVGDLNGDGWPDLIAGTQNSNVVSVFINNGAGSLPANPTRFITTSNHPMAVAIADVTGDSRMDVITAHGGPGIPDRGVYVHPGDGAGGFGAPIIMNSADGSKTLLVTDLNRDGRPDIIVSNGQNGRRVDVFRNLGGGSFVLHQSLTTAYVGSMVTGDFNGDGWTDIALTEGGFFGYTGMRVLLNDRTGSIEQAVYLTPFGYPGSVADVDGDGKSEFIVPTSGTPGLITAYAFHNRSAPGMVVRGPIAFHDKVHMGPGSTLSGNLNFGTQIRQMLNLWDKSYGIGVQNGTFYCRSDDQYVWYKGGYHSDFGGPGFGGSELMRLNSTELRVNGTVVSASDRNVKGGFESVDPESVLEKVASLPIARWHYTNDVTTTHIGPVAQDFHAAFSVGSGDKHIATVDADGVALAAIQGLNRKLENLLKEKDARILELERRLDALEKRSEIRATR
jgi:hypothetical protein